MKFDFVVSGEESKRLQAAIDVGVESLQWQGSSEWPQGSLLSNKSGNTSCAATGVLLWES